MDPDSPERPKPAVWQHTLQSFLAFWLWWDCSPAFFFFFSLQDYEESAFTCYQLYWSGLEAIQRGIVDIQNSSKSWIRNPHLHSTCYLSGPLWITVLPEQSRRNNKAEKLSTNLGFLLIFFLVMAFRAHQEPWIALVIYTSPSQRPPSYLAPVPVFLELVFGCARVWAHKSNFRVHSRRKGGIVVAFPQHSEY